MKPLFESCPRYLKCSVNNCPLDTEYPNGYIEAYDEEQKCSLAKSYRMLVAAQRPGFLRYEGMTSREHSSWTRWNSLSPAEQAARREKLAIARSKIS